MERTYNRNQNSYRPRRNDSREDYQSGKRKEDHVDYRGKRFSRFSEDQEKRRFTKSFRRSAEDGEKNYSSPKMYRGENHEERPTKRRFQESWQGVEERRDSRYKKGERKEDRELRGEFKKRSFKKENINHQEWISDEKKEKLRAKHYSKKKILAHRLKNQSPDSELRLNRFISMGGICSRRDADELIVLGRVKVNGEIVQTVGQKVRFSDCVEVDGVQVLPEKKVYLVLNKPKDYVTTVEDPLERKTVMSLIEGACKERIYPVGRLDRQTTGVLLFTNDGDLAKKLTHPKYAHKKIYHVYLDKPLLEEDLHTISAGIELEDGFIKADEINYASLDCTEVGIEIHSGKNRIVRRIFEHLGYQIIKLDRVYFSGITKKNLPRGTWRFLTPKEVNILKVY